MVLVRAGFSTGAAELVLQSLGIMCYVPLEIHAEW
jgi:hypothetical protein